MVKDIANIQEFASKLDGKQLHINMEITLILQIDNGIKGKKNINSKRRYYLIMIKVKKENTIS